MREIYFDLGSIYKIEFLEETEENSYVWKESKIVKKFFGLGKHEFTKEGFFYVETYNPYWVSPDYIEQIGFKVIDKKIYRKPVVKVYLEKFGSNHISKSFETNQEAKRWVKKLSERSGKKFEIVKF
jgi:hypothetical protein